MRHPEKLHKRTDYLWLVLIILLGALPRLHLILATNSVIDSDEAIVGLMAKHILEGKPWPVFYYGQNYMGSLEAILAALSFSFFGPGNFSLKLVPFVFSLWQICLVFFLARRFVGRFAAHFAALLAALGPSALILWSSMARGGFIEVVVLGSISLIIAADMLSGRLAPHKMSMFWLGAVLGLGWWVNNQIIFYIAAISPILAVFLWQHKQSLFQLMPLGLAAAVGFFLGGWPFWWANLFQRPLLVTFRELLFAHPAQSGFREHFTGFFQEALPIIFGARRFWSDTDIFPYASAFLYAFYIPCFLYVLWLGLKKWRKTTEEAGKPNFSLYLLLILFFVATCLIFSASSFGWLTKAPRYLLPLYSILFIFPAIAVDSLQKTKKLHGYIMACMLGTALLGFQLASCYAGGLAIPGQPFIYKGERVMENHAPLYAWLRENNYSHIRTNYWIGYRTAFETGEEITFSRFGTPRSLRLPDYEKKDPMQDLRGVYVLSPLEAANVANSFDKIGYSYRRSKVGGYIVLDRVAPVVKHGPAIPLLAEQITASSRQDWVGAMLDHNLGTRWGSGTPQRPGMSLMIDLRQLLPVSGLDLDLGSFPQDVPRELLIQGEKVDGSWEDLFNSKGTFYDPREYDIGEFSNTWQIFFSPRCFKRLRLLELGKADPFDWSVAELGIYRAPDPAPVCPVQ